jgi:hypothetical protein
MTFAMHLDIVHVYIHSKNNVSRKPNSYNLEEWSEYCILHESPNISVGVSFRYKFSDGAAIDKNMADSFHPLLPIFKIVDHFSFVLN